MSIQLIADRLEAKYAKVPLHAVHDGLEFRRFRHGKVHRGVTFPWHGADGEDLPLWASPTCDEGRRRYAEMYRRHIEENRFRSPIMSNIKRWLSELEGQMPALKNTHTRKKKAPRKSREEVIDMAIRDEVEAETPPDTSTVPADA